MPPSDEGPLQMAREADANALNALRERCRAEGRELLTPKAITALFDISNAAVRAARLHGKVTPEVTMAITGKPVDLINLESALRYWKLPEDMPTTLERMREHGTTATVGGQFYNILHDEDLMTLNAR